MYLNFLRWQLKFIFLMLVKTNDKLILSEMYTFVCMKFHLEKNKIGEGVMDGCLYIYQLFYVLQQSYLILESVCYNFTTK